MRGANWIRVVLCGVVAGIVWNLLSAISLSLFAEDLLAFVEKGGSYPRAGGAFFFVIDLMMGIWAIWLYSTIAPRLGAGPKTAAIAGAAWWIIKGLESAKWVGLGLIPRGVALIPLATTLVSVLVASMLGAWLYDRVDSPAADIPAAGERLCKEETLEHITGDMKVAEVVRRCPAAAEVFLARGCPDMRRGFFNLMARLMSVRSAARMHKLDLVPLLEDLNRVALGATRLAP